MSTYCESTATDKQAMSPHRKSGFWNFAPAILLGTGLLCLSLVKIMTSLPEDGSVAIVFTPWSEASRRSNILIETDARIYRVAMGGMVVFAASEEPGLADRLKTQDVLAVINPGALGGCGA